MPGKPSIPVTCEGCGETFFTWPYKLRMGEGKFCKRACQALRDRRTTPERFWANVDKDGPPPAHRPELGPCWLWMAHTVRGYGHFQFEGRQRQAHAVAYILTYGPLPADKPFTCHHCDVRPCVRPSHLFAGDQDDNMTDMVTKGRSAIGTRNGRYTQPERTPRGDRHWAVARREEVNRGSRHHNAKITEAIVIEARARYAAGGVTMQSLADWAGVSKPVMHKIIRRQAWTHVP